MIFVICLIMIGLMANTFIEDPVTSIIGCIVPAVGLVLYQLVFKKSREAVVNAENTQNEEEN